MKFYEILRLPHRYKRFCCKRVNVQLCNKKRRYKYFKIPPERAAKVAKVAKFKTAL